MQNVADEFTVLVLDYYNLFITRNIRDLKKKRTMQELVLEFINHFNEHRWKVSWEESFEVDDTVISIEYKTITISAEVYHSLAKIINTQGKSSQNDPIPSLEKP